MSPLGGNSQARIGTVILVTAVTLLIWIFAAGETRERAVIWARVQFEAASGITTIVSPRTTQQIALTLSGSTRSIQEVRRALEEPLVLATGTKGIPGDKGTHLVEIVDALRDQEVFYKTEVSVITSEPMALEVQIDSLIEKTIPVTPVIQGATLGGEAVAEPPDVTVTMPSSLVAVVPDISVIAEPSEKMISRLEPGRRHVIQSPLRLPEELRAYEDEISISPRSVQLAFPLILRTRTLPLAQPVPIQIAAPAQDLAEYTVEITDQFLADVVIEGAAEDVKKFEEDLTPVVAFIHLTSDDLARGITEAEVTLWELPEGLRVVSVAGSGSQPIVSLKITRNDG
jgi:hypothetical protein